MNVTPKDSRTYSLPSQFGVSVKQLHGNTIFLLFAAHNPFLQHILVLSASWNQSTIFTMDIHRSLQSKALTPK
ncbi:hypothetical protein K432DRAFT_376706 [Lepidopterella palustris CBS 459.81]|uniref:Uncharacterized protein n=1 Tax=Lepidopterella palustris CBS 459.81 TaxID=1314670 RepID=A0A8E2EM29_9PEZI|nr:hypothetical protein K432DRAFT_376706 [Lepidopterella palustris CBS 459.81]